MNRRGYPAYMLLLLVVVQQQADADAVCLLYFYYATVYCVHTAPPHNQGSAAGADSMHVRI